MSSDKFTKVIRTQPIWRIAIAATLVVTLAVAATGLARSWWVVGATNTYVAYFANTNGLYTGDDIRILGVTVGTVEKIEPQPHAAKVTFSVDAQYPVPADVKAAILSPSLVSARAIQLVPAYSGGPKLAEGATIPLERTAVPVEWDDFRQQLQKLSESLQPTSPGGPSAVGEFINSTADNLRGQGDTARDTVIKLSTGNVGARRSQHRHLQHGAQSPNIGVGSVFQQRSAGRVQHQHGLYHHRDVAHSQ